MLSFFYLLFKYTPRLSFSEMSGPLTNEQRRIMRNLEHNFMFSRRIWPINPESDLQNLEWVVFEPRVYDPPPRLQLSNITQDIQPNSNILSENFECPICMNTIMPQNKHFRTECGHQFCWACIHNLNFYMQNNKANTNCPLCRKTIVSRSSSA